MGQEEWIMWYVFILLRYKNTRYCSQELNLHLRIIAAEIVFNISVGGLFKFKQCITIYKQCVRINVIVSINQQRVYMIDTVEVM